MKDIRIAFVDFWPTFKPEEFLLTRILKTRYNIIIDVKNPEYIICSQFGTNYLKYDCVRIMFMGEARCPDFNVYDYALAFEDIHFGDRYLCYPLFLTYEKNLALALKKHLNVDEKHIEEKKFCNTVVSNDLGCNVRDAYFDALCTYKMVDSGGRHKNNLPDGQPVPDKLAFQKNYKFSMAFENSRFPGYVTEKIVDAWAAGTIPIYWGAPDVKDYFNAKAFVDCSAMESPEELIPLIKELDQDEDRVRAMLREPIVLPESKLASMLASDYLEQFLFHIFDQPLNQAKRRNSAFTMWGYNHEHHLAQVKKLEDNRMFKQVRKVMKKFK